MGFNSSFPPVTIEFLDNGMIVHYYEPIKRPKVVHDTTASLLAAVIPQMLESVLENDEGDDWSDEKRAQKESLKAAIEKAKSMASSSPKEEWVWAERRIVVSGNDALGQAVAKARDCHEKAAKLRDAGEVVRMEIAGYLSPASIGGFA